MATKPELTTVFFVRSRRAGEHVDHRVLIGDSLEAFSLPISALVDPAAWSRAVAALKALVETRGGNYHGDHGRAMYVATEAALEVFTTERQKQILVLAEMNPIAKASGMRIHCVDGYIDGDVSHLEKIGKLKLIDGFYTVRKDW